MMLGRRRFVNMVAEKYRTGVWSLHRLDVSEHLFYPSTAEVEAARAKPEVSKLGGLPAPTMSFQSTPGLKYDQYTFALVSPRSNESRILWASPAEKALLCDLDSRSNYDLPNLRYKGKFPITISIARPDAEEEDLYVMSSIPFSIPHSSTFEVLRFGRPKHYPGLWLYPDPPDSWQWHSLRPPPLDERLTPIIRSHAVLHGGRTICVTAQACGGDEDGDTAGTYLFDTVERRWSEAPYEWHLPFSGGGAEYVPDLRVWLGFAGDSHRPCLCAWDDLDAAIEEERPPTLKHRWEERLPEDWMAISASIVNLGEGRFCIFKLIEDVEGREDDDDDFLSYHPPKMLALLTGVEISPGPEQDGREGLRFVKHKSLYYVFTQDQIEWVL